jgi:predicted amidohydrolase YtcJ
MMNGLRPPALAVAVTIAFAAAAGPAPAESPGATADLVLLNGRVITVDERDSIVEAVAVKDGRILALGSTREIDALAGPQTQRVDLRGKAATPGLIDAHCHFAAGAVDLLFVLDLAYPVVKGMADVVAKVRERATATNPGDWVVGRGWDEGKLAERRYIYASDLDPVSPRHPVWLSHTMGHYGVANSAALKLAGIGRDTPDPDGGTIDRGPDGMPTGVLKEHAQGLVERLVPPASRQQRRQAIAHLAREFGKEGMTGLKDPGIDPETWEDYQQVLAEGGLSVRVFALWSAGRTVDEVRSLVGRIGPLRHASVSTAGRLVAGGVKLFMDGSGGARTAWLHEDWNKNHTEMDSGNRGYPVVEPGVIREQIRVLHDAGLHVSVHAIGDRAIDWVVDSYALALEANPVRGLRHGIIHANIPTDRAIEAMAGLQRRYDAGYPEPSATFMWWIGDTYAGNFGPQRCRRLNPFRTYLEKGIRWAAGSDFPVTPFPARYGLWSAVARETLLGVYGKSPYGSEQSVDIRAALRSHTITAARQMFMEKEVGSLEVGKRADIAVWDQDPYAAPTPAIKDMKCLMTVSDGKAVHRASEIR